MVSNFYWIINIIKLIEFALKTQTNHILNYEQSQEYNYEGNVEIWKLITELDTILVFNWLVFIFYNKCWWPPIVQ